MTTFPSMIRFVLRELMTLGALAAFAALLLVIAAARIGLLDIDF